MENLQEKLILLDSILQNTQEQTKAIVSDDMDTLGVLINQREAMMLKVDELDIGITDTAEEVTPEQADLVKSLLSQIITIDNTNQSTMQNELGDIQRELCRIRAGRKQEEHYSDEYGLYKEEGIFFDTKE